MNELLLCEENYGSNQGNNSYRVDSSGEVTRLSHRRKWSSVTDFFTSVFLPQGYPDSVSSDYLTYQLYDTLQALCSYITGTLATQAVLKGAGVGDENASVIAATLTWILRDGTGMVGRIGFAWWKGSKFDRECKRWRLFADILNDTALLVELSSPFFPRSYFTLISCTAGLARSLVGVAGGATRAALTMHQARRNNMADVAAKDGSQETLVNLLGLVVGLLITPVVAGNPSLTWTLFFLFTLLHLYANYRAVTSVVMETLNHSRLHVLVEAYLDSRCSQVLSPAEANRLEPVLTSFRLPFQTVLGASFGSVVSRREDLYALSRYSQETFGGYLLGAGPAGIHVVLHRDCTPADVIRASFQAELINYAGAHASHQGGGVLGELAAGVGRAGSASSRSQWMEEVVGPSYQLAAKIFPAFLGELEACGWTVAYTLLGPDEWRAHWDLRGISHKKNF